MERERCPVCGASVKRENLNGHVERVHPKQPLSATRPASFGTSTRWIKSHRRRNIALATLLLLAVVGLSIGFQQFVLANTQQMHIHPIVSATINGSPVTIPSEIGIDPSLWVDHSLDQYGIGMAVLHTHDTSGKVHVESNTVRDFTLQEFLSVWGKKVDASQVLGHPVDAGHRAYFLVNGVEKPVTEDPTFLDGERIQIICGP